MSYVCNDDTVSMSLSVLGPSTKDITVQSSLDIRDPMSQPKKIFIIESVPCIESAFSRALHAHTSSAHLMRALQAHTIRGVIKR